MSRLFPRLIGWFDGKKRTPPSDQAGPQVDDHAGVTRVDHPSSATEDRPTLQYEREATPQDELAEAQPADEAVPAAREAPPTPLVDVSQVARAAASLTAEGNFDAAETMLDEALAAAPKSIELMVAHARVAQARRDWPEALRRYEAIITHHPQRWWGYRGKIEVLTNSGRREDADATLLESATKLPDSAEAIHDLAVYAERVRRWDYAEENWRLFLQRADQLPWGHSGLARALYQQGRYHEAEAVLKDAAIRFPNDKFVAVEIARLHDKKEDFVASAEQWRSVAKIMPDSAMGPIGEVEALRRQGRIADSDRVLEEAMPRLPNEPDLHDMYGQNALAWGDLELARTRYLAAQGRFPSTDIFRQRLHSIALHLPDESSRSPNEFNVNEGVNQYDSRI